MVLFLLQLSNVYCSVEMTGSRSSGDAQSAPRQKVHYPFWFGGSASCCAAAVTHPLDLGESISAMPLRLHNTSSY